ncbi:MAG: hypothetical protein DKINENOH_04782 [bacterium]|nr:hypothetical protein [bacterium]
MELSFSANSYGDDDGESETNLEELLHVAVARLESTNN